MYQSVRGATLCSCDMSLCQDLSQDTHIVFVRELGQGVLEPGACGEGGGSLRGCENGRSGKSGTKHGE